MVEPYLTVYACTIVVSNLQKIPPSEASRSLPSIRILVPPVTMPVSGMNYNIFGIGYTIKFMVS
jgi:hypothetical protein